MTSASLELVKKLTSERSDSPHFAELLASFARIFGWRPSFKINGNGFDDVVNAHIMIEHGLENTAVLSFIKNRDFLSLDPIERKNFIGISYNNLVDWHIIIQNDAIYYVYNRNDLMKINKINLDEQSIDMLRYEAFQKLVGRKPNPNILALDEALIRRIEYWRSNLPNLINGVTLEEISDFFNCIIFIRSMEDFYRSSDGRFIDLLSIDARFTESVVIHLAHLDSHDSAELLNLDRLTPFNNLDHRDLLSIVKDFYGNSHFSYDFSLMTKHALGKIYEKYVSLLEITFDAQPTLFPRPLREIKSRTLGTFYTPQYIASFFSREIKQFFSNSEILKIKAIDPTCGSGVFLRNLLERIIDEEDVIDDKELVSNLFDRVYGVDINYNAIQASKLSLSLLHLVSLGRLPEKLNMINHEVISYFSSNTNEYETYDVVISNPPYIPTEEMDRVLKDSVIKFLDPVYSGRPEFYLAAIYLGFKLLKPGGIGLFVIPQSFLVNSNALPIRKILSEGALIRTLVDLSSIEVFEGVGAHVILLIFEKKSANPRTAHSLISVVNGLPGHALEQISERVLNDSDLYQITQVDQNNFADGNWILLSEKENRIRSKMAEQPALSKYMKSTQGVVTGNDSIFIRNLEEIPIEEIDIYAPLLPDKKMRPYVIDHVPEKYIIYPPKIDKNITEVELEEKYPSTYKYLLNNKSRLDKGGSKEKWWMPHRTRDPEILLAPKIVAPHLLITPKFAIDLEGRWAVTRASFFSVKKLRRTQYDDNDTIKIFAAIMNSSPFNWYNSTISQKYGSGYTMIENKTINKVPVPDIDKIEPVLGRRIVNIVDDMIINGPSRENVNLLDQIICGLYGLTREEANSIGVRYENIS